MRSSPAPSLTTLGSYDFDVTVPLSDSTSDGIGAANGPPKPPVPVATMLTPVERARVDAAGEGSYETYHRDTVEEVADDLKCNRANAVLVSITRCDPSGRAGVAALVREFPHVPTVALLTQMDRSTPNIMLSLGSTGLRQVVDVREPDGWRELRSYLLAARGEDIQREALTRLAIDLAGVSRDCWRFFEALFICPPRVTTIRAFSRRLDVLPSTLMSRFYRLVAGTQALLGGRAAGARGPPI